MFDNALHTPALLFFEISETATRNLLASAESKRAVSEHAQEHATGFGPAVLDKTPKDRMLREIKESYKLDQINGKIDK